MELLAPAGDYDSFIGAVHAGADAVYLGGEKFGARAYADNFDTDSLLRVLDEAHLFGRKVYLTANVLTRQEELGELTGFVHTLYLNGLDGAIIQDLGVAAALREKCPGLPLHASTQMSVTGAEAVRFLRKLGFSRVVPARELSLEEICALNAKDPDGTVHAPMEIEAFIHGAMCYSFSGRCLMSSFLGGRSGNRGRCAGTCRLPYKVFSDSGEAMPLEPYPISMKDMCVLQILPELIDAGIDSFKIEGRMKRAEYAAGTTAIYRRYIDRFYEWDREGRPGKWSVDPEDEKMLRHLYIRSDLSTGYYHQYNGKNMVTLHKPGYLGAEDALLEEIRKQYIEQKPVLKIDAAAVFIPGQEAQFSVWTVSDENSGNSRCFGNSGYFGNSRYFENFGNSGMSAGADAGVSVTGETVLKAQKRPLSEEELRTRLSRTGDSFFEIREIDVTTDGEAFLPVSAVNDLRRRALDELREKICQASRRNPDDYDNVLIGTDAKVSVPADKNVKPVKSDSEDPCESSGSTASGTGSTAPGTGSMALGTGSTDRRIYIVVTSEEQLSAATDVLLKDKSGDRIPVLILDGDLPQQLAAGEISIPEHQPAAGRIPVPGLQMAAGEFSIPGLQLMAAFPYVFRDRDREKLQSDYLLLKDKVSGFLVRTIEELEFLHENEYYGKVMSDASLYQWNLSCRGVLSNYCETMTLPLELSREELRRTFGDEAESSALMVYGHIPMMITQNCVRKTAGRCLRRENGFWSIEDRKDVRFPVRTVCTFCHNIIYNSVPLSLHGYTDDFLYQNAGGILLSFTGESAEETGSIISGFLKDWKLCPGDRAGVPVVYTTGHYKKGAI